MNSKSYRLRIIGVMVFSSILLGIKSCSFLKAIGITDNNGNTNYNSNTSNTLCKEGASKVPLLDGSSEDPQQASVVLGATPCTQIIFKEEKKGGSPWVKVEIRNREVWIDQGHLDCKEPKSGQSCKIK